MIGLSVCLLLVATFADADEYQLASPYGLVGAYAPEYKNYEPHNYQFDYAVSDPHTGDHKSQWEVKENGVVKGGYSLLEPDGTTRVVEYIADHDGFRAVVKKIGTAVHPVPVQVPVHQPVALPLPVEEPKPVYLDYNNAYNGYYENYIPKTVVPEPVVQYEAPKVVLPAPLPPPPQPLYYHPQPAPIPQAVPYYGGAHVEQPHVRVEYHGFTGNDGDDSEYTKYDGHGVANANYNGDGGYYYGGEQAYNNQYEESRPQLVAVPYKSVQGYQQPLPYQLVVKY